MIVLELAKEFAKDQTLEVAVAINSGILADKVLSHGIKTYILPDKGFMKIPFFYLRFLRMTRDFEPDIVHSHHRYPTLLAQVFPLFKAYRLIHTFHLEQFTKRWLRFFGDCATAVSKGCKDHFVKYFNLKEDSITVIYNGVNFPDCNTQEPPIKKQDGETIISLVGRLTEQKGHVVLLRAITLLPNAVRNKLRVFFVGDGEKRKKLKEETKRLGLEENIVFTGYEKDVYPYIMASDFTVLPSLWEGFGRVIIESYLCGKPVIGSSVGGIPELIRDNETGLLVRPNDPSALANAIVYFMDNPALVKKYGEAGKKIALEKFTAAKMIENYKVFYKKVLEENSAN